uniref:Uncharacterized protein n=1 Tax=Rhizophora mucronata TaxID=61149 RepID=A0A2P2NIM1_RHIMU
MPVFVWSYLFSCFLIWFWHFIEHIECMQFKIDGNRCSSRHSFLLWPLIVIV